MPHFYDLGQVTPEYASETGWNKRGYKVMPNQQYGAVLEYWNGMYWQNVTLYHFRQCEPIQGKKAKKRRDEWKTLLWEKAKNDNGRT